MQKLALSILDEHDFEYLVPKIQQKIMGTTDTHQFMTLNPIYNVLFMMLPVPFGIFLSSISMMHTRHEFFITNKTNIFLKNLNHVNTDILQNFIAKIQSKIQSQSVLNAIQFHQWNDTYALLAQKDTPFTPVFIPKKVIDCKGITAIRKDPAVKKNLLKQANRHLKLSPKKRALFLDKYSLVRSITPQDCEKECLSPVLIGQSGVFARIDLPKYFFLGFYSGFYFANPTEAYDYFNIIGDVINVYLFRHENQIRPMVSAYRGGNRISLINSATDYSGTAEQIAHQLFFVQNMLPIDFKTDNNPDDDIRNTPNMFDISGYITTRNICAGEQLFVDYGYDYWQNKNRSDVTLNEIDAVYLALKEKSMNSINHISD